MLSVPFRELVLVRNIATDNCVICAHHTHIHTHTLMHIYTHTQTHAHLVPEGVSSALPKGIAVVVGAAIDSTVRP